MKVFKYLSFIILFLMMLSCNNNDRELIERYYQESSLMTGAGKTTITTIEIITTNNIGVKAYVEGYNANNSLSNPTTRGFKDTLYFKYYLKGETQKVKIVSSLK